MPDFLCGETACSDMIWLCIVLSCRVTICDNLWMMSMTLSIGVDDPVVLLFVPRSSSFTDNICAEILLVIRSSTGALLCELCKL